MIAKDQSGLSGQATNSTVSTIGGTLLTIGAMTGGPATPWGLGLMVAGAAAALGGAMLNVFGVGVRNPIEDRDVKSLNELEVALRDNVSKWSSGSKTNGEQQQRLQYAQTLLDQMNALCHDPGLGENWATGCIKDRQRGGKFDWFAVYYDPIANTQASDAGRITGMLDATVGVGNSMYVGIGLLVLGLVVVSKD